jgi:pimeloyl-ACP methyl ester carboxylesterase
MNTADIKRFALSRAGLAAAAATVSAAVVATWVESRARRAEQEHPPTGRFIEVDGARLHCVERGEGPPVVLLHGNAVSLQDFIASGLVDRLAQNHRVILIDRPGFGHSTRPRNRLWTPFAQAKAIGEALRVLKVERPVVVGHSMGTLVALAMALDAPADVKALVLLGGYYYPALRVDALLTAPVASPVIGDLMRYTVTALSSRAMLGGAVKAMFDPLGVPAGFFPLLSREMMVRPVQLRANAEDAAFMMPAAQQASGRYGELNMPVTLLAGEDDGVVDPEKHATRLHAELPQSKLVLVPGTGHMVHYVAHDAVAEAVSRGS